MAYKALFGEGSSLMAFKGEDHLLWHYLSRCPSGQLVIDLFI